MHRGFAPALVTVIAVGLGASPAIAQTDTRPVPTLAPINANSGPLVGLASADTQTLADALRAVSVQAGVAFVAEGKPFRARNSAPPLAPIAAKWPAKGMPLDEAVEKIAGAYDYETERKGEVFLLRKRYSNPDDLPDVTAEELRLALRDASRAALTLPAPTVPPADFTDVNSPFMADLFRTLKPSQQTEGYRGMGGGGFIKISDLTPRQKDALWQCAVSRHIQAATGKAVTAYKALQTMEQKNTFFSFQNVETTQKKTVQVLSYTPKRLDTAVYPSFALKGQLWFNTPAPSDYGADGIPLPVSELAEGVEAETLQNFCDRTGKGLHLTVDPVLAAKTPLIILPSKNTDEQEATVQRIAVFRAIGDVYGLRVLHLPNDTFYLTRGRIVTAQTVGDLNRIVPAAFPAPLMRAFHGAADVETAKALASYMKRDENEPDFDPKKPNDAQLIFAKGTGRTKGADALLHAALRRFHVLVEPRVAGGKTVLFADLGKEEHRLLMLALASECLNDVDKLTSEMPPPTQKGLEQGHLQNITMGNEVFYMGKVPKEMENTCRFIFYLSLADEKGDTKNGSSYNVGNVTVPIPPAKGK